jgi:hypothetical protein
MKWEYQQLVTDTFAEGVARLNNLGDDGWELVTAFKTEREHSMFILKRPKAKASVKRKTVKSPGRK